MQSEASNLRGILLSCQRRSAGSGYVPLFRAQATNREFDHEALHKGGLQPLRPERWPPGFNRTIVLLNPGGL